MNTDKKKIWTKYVVCIAVAALVTLAVFAMKGFFTDRIEANMGILADGFTVSGVLLTAFAGLFYVNSEGVFIGIGFVLRNIVQAFLPMGRRHHEFYGQYRERKLGEFQKSGDHCLGNHCLLVVGLTFLAIGLLFNLIWYVKYYQPPV